MRRALIPKPFKTSLTLMDPTPDGCAELVLEVNGHPVASTVIMSCNAEDIGWYDRITEWRLLEVLRRC